MTAQQRLSRIRIWLCLFAAGLLLAGISAFPLEWESRMLSQWLHGPGSWAADSIPPMRAWIAQVRHGLTVSYHRYPWLAYGIDWLVFAHLAIAIAFAGPIRDPVRNKDKWVAQFGMIACSLVVPLAAICGQLRGIPLFWLPIDMSFGVLGIVPLILSRPAYPRARSQQRACLSEASNRSAAVSGTGRRRVPAGVVVAPDHGDVDADTCQERAGQESCLVRVNNAPGLRISLLGLQLALVACR
jgi:hypothetical protein